MPISSTKRSSCQHLLILLLTGILLTQSIFAVAGDSSEVRIYSSPTAIEIVPNTSQTKCQGETVIFSVTGSASGDQFQWKRNGVNILNATSVSYTASITGDYSCTVISSTGVTTNTPAVTLTIKPLPNVTITASDLRFCTGGSATLTPDGATSYVWTPASNLVANATTDVATVNPTNSGTTATNFTYTVTGTGTNSCKNTENIIITVDPLPAVPNINTNPNTQVCSGTAINFSTTAATGQTYLWDFGDGTADGIGASVNHPFTTNVGNGNQNFTVRLTTTVTATGCKRAGSEVVTIKQRPDADLSDYVNPNSPFSICEGTSLTNEIQVTNTSSTTSTNTLYNIDWGDGTPNFTASNWAANATTTHTYTSLGFFNLRLTITGQNGCVASKTYSAYKGSNPQVPYTNPGNSTNVCVPFTYSLNSLPNNNPPGTSYTVLKNDGTPDVVLSTPLPTVYSHTFTNTSCGATGGTLPGTYYFKIRAENPCGVSFITIEPITTSIKPISDFTISQDTVCINQNVTFTNTSIKGVEVLSNGTCVYTSPKNWTISPSNGWSTVSGSLGDVSPNTNPNTWGSDVLTLQFSNPGVYDIKHSVKNRCGIHDTTKKVCVQEPTLPSFTVNTNNGCGPLTINTTNTSTKLPICGTYTREWVVTKLSNTCLPATTTDYEFTGTSTATSESPSIKFNNQGVYSIVLKITNKCGTQVSSTTFITVKAKPQMDVNALAEICAGKKVVPTADTLHCASNITTINWTFTGGSPSSSTNFLPGEITYNSAGSFPVKLTVTNACGSTTDEKTLTVNALPTISGGTSVCVGKNLQLSGSASPATTNAWTSSDPTKASIDGNGRVTGIAEGTTIITYTNDKGCQQSLTLSVLPRPTITGTLSLCKNSTTSLTGSLPTPSGNGWSTSDGNIATINASGLVTGISNGNATITYTNGNGCTQTATATIFALPIITGDDNICIGTTQPIAGNGTPATSNAWTSSTSNISITGNGINASIRGDVVGSSVITYTDNNGCKQTKTIDVKALPVIGNLNPVCVNNTLALTGSPAAATSNAWVSTPTTIATISTSGLLSAIASGTVSITYEDLNGCKKTEAITVNALPVISGPDNVCKGAAINLTGDGTPASPTAWSSSSTGIASVDNSGAVSGTATGTVTITYTNNNGCKRTKSIDVKPIPSITTSSTNPSACGSSNGSISISGLTPNSSYTLNYSVSGSPVSPINITTGAGVSTYVISSLSAGSYNPINVTLNGCKSNDERESLSNPTAPETPVITPISALCSGNNFTLNINNVTAGVTYNWSGPLVPSSTTGNSYTQNNAPSTASGTFSVTATKDGCVSAAGNVAVTVNPTPNLPGATTPINYCQGATTAVLSAIPDATNNLVWYNTSSGSSPLANAPTPTSVNTGTQSFYVSQKTAFCEGPRKQIDVIVNLTPAAPTVSGYQICQFRSASALTATLANASYTAVWYDVASAGTPLSSAPTPITATTGSTTYYVSQRTTEGCEGPRASITATIKPTPTIPTISSPVEICEDVIASPLTATASSSNTLKWYEDASGGSALPTAPTPNTSSAGQQDFYVTQTNSDQCESDRAEIIVNIKPAPAAPVVTSPISICQNSTATALSATALPNHTLQWFSSTTALSGPPTPITTSTGTTTYSVQQTNTSNGCTGPKATISVEVKPTPIISGTDKTNPTNCNTPTGSITINGLTNGQTYTVHVRTPTNNDSTFNATANSQGKITIGNLVSGSYQNIYVDLNGCPSNTVGPITLVDPNPPAAPSVSSNSPICSGNTIVLQSSSTASGTQSFQWSGPNGYTSAVQNPSIANASTLAGGTYLVTLTINSCKSQPSSVEVKVDSTPVAPVLGSNSPVCSENAINLTATTSSTMPVSWAWTGPASFTSTDQNPTRTNATESMEGVYKATATAAYPVNNQNCKSSESAVNVVVNPTPKITTVDSDGPTNCNTATGKITLNGLSNSTNYEVKFFTPTGNDTTINITSNASGQVIISGLRSGSYSNIRVVLTNCPSNSVGPIALADPNPPAAPTASSNAPAYCSGNTISFSASSTATGTQSYQWSGPNGFTSTDQNPSIANASTADAGNYLVTLTINSCKSQASTIIVKVDSTPVAPVLGSNSPVCSENTINLTATTSSTMPVTWAWTGPTSFTSTDQNPTRTNATESMEGVYKATATAAYPANNQSCKSGESTVNVLVNPTPKITTVDPVGPTNCNTATGKITLNGLSNSTNYEVKFFTPTGNDTIINITSNASGQVIISGLRSGSYSNIRVVLTNCPSNSVGPIALADPNPPAAPTASSNSAICQNQTLNLTISSPIANGIYNWTGPQNYQQAGTTPSISSAQPNQSGDYSVTVTLNDCKSPATVVPVIIHPNPVEPLADDMIYCQLVIAVPLIATPLNSHTIRWYDNNNILLSTAPDPSTALATTLIYFVSQVSPEGCEGPKNQVDVLVRPTPSIASPQQTSVCTNAAFTITPSGSGVPSGTTYSWTIPVFSNPQLTNGSAATDQPNINGTLNNGTDNEQTATYTVTPKTPFCTGVDFNAVVTVKPAPRVVFTPVDQIVCSGTAIASVSLSSPTPGVSLPWTATIPSAINGATASGNNTINAFTAVNNSSILQTITYSSTATTTPTTGGTGCSGAPSTYTIKVKPTPNVDDKTLSFCSGESWSFAPTDQPPTEIVPAGTLYTWVISTNAAIQGATGQSTPTDSLRQQLRNLTNVPQTIRYTIKPISDDCLGDEFFLDVTIYPTPEITNQSTTICSENSFSIIPTTSIIPSGTTYSWNNPTAPTGVSGSVSGTSATSIDGTLTNSTFAALNLIYRVSPKSGVAGACVGDTFDVVITINPRAAISNNPVKQTICTNQSSSSVTWQSFTTSASYAWTLSYSGAITGFASDGNGPVLNAMTLQNNGSIPDSVIYLVSSTASNCAGPATPYIIVVNPDAKAFFGFTADTACWPFQLSITNNSPRWSFDPNVPNGSYNWYQVNPTGTTALINTGLNFSGYTIPGPSDSVEIKLEAISFYGCLNNSFSHRFFTRPKPAADLSLFNPDSCGPRFIHFTNLTNLKDTFDYQWTFGNGQGSSLVDPIDVRYEISPFYVDTTYYVKLVASNECDRSEKTDSVIVRASPKARFAVSSSAGCSPFTIQIQNTSLGNPTTYYWDYGNGNKDTVNATGNSSYTYITGVVDTFDLMLIAESDCGRDTQIIEIKVAPNVIRPGISINASELFGCVDHEVRFINTSFGATQFRWNFGDGSPIQSTNVFQNPVNHIFTTPGTFDVRVDMTNGCSDTFVTKQIVVYPGPDARFNAPSSICLGDTLKPINQSSNASNYFWSFGDGISSSLENPEHLYRAAGIYIIRLEALQTSPQGQVCFDTMSRTVTVVAKPDTNLNTNINTVNCSPFRVTGNFTGYTNETITWIVYDTTLPTAPIVLSSPQLDYTFNGSGQFKIVAIIENVSGCKDSTSRTFFVYAKPQAAFSPLNIGTCSLDTTVTYQNQTTANIYTPLRYRWYVDNTLRSSNGNFSYRYSSGPAITLPREFQTKLVAINSVGCADSVTGILTMYPTPKSRFTISNTNACLPFVANINNTSTYTTENKWYLNDSLVSTDPNPSILIRSANTNYSIKHVVTNGYGCVADSTSQTFRTRVMPIARFTLTDTLGCDGQLNVRPVNNSQFATSFQWNWGDGSPINTQINPSYLYRNIGTFRVTLTAKDAFCQDTISRLVYVSEKPVVDFESSLTRSCDTTTLQLINLTTNASAYTWVINNNSVSTDFSPTVTLNPSPTPYSITLIAGNAAGCKDSLTKANYIQVIPPPAADFYVTPNDVISIPNYAFGFTNLTPNFGYYLYNWSMGDSSYYDTRDIIRHQYSDTGKYLVSLVVTDTNTNCSRTVKKIVQIVGQPGYLYVPNAFYPNSRQLEFQGFKPVGKGLKEYQLQIFDNWGKLLFMTDKLDAAGRPIEAWDGTFKGKPMPQDAYAWRIKARFRNGLAWDGMQYDQRKNDKPGQTFGTVTLFR